MKTTRSRGAASAAPAAEFVASGFGLGWIPVASGTFGTLPGVLIVVLLWPVLPMPALQTAVALVLAAIAIPICGAAERSFGRKDDQRIVADEFLTFPICMIGLPVTLDHWWLVVMAFITFRICDILKPPPAHQLQRLHGGLGVVADDVFAALYSLGINHGLYLTIRHFLEGDIGF